MKRLLAALAIVASLAAASTQVARATISPPPAGAQIQWTSAATVTMAIVTQYSAAFAQGNALPTLLPSVAGVCTAAGTEANYTLTFGALNTRNVPTACLYKNALAVSVQTNDASGFVVNEYLDATPTTGVGICAFPNGGASFPLAPAIAPVATSARGGNPAAGTFTGMALTSCAAGGSIIPPGAGGASSGGATPGNPGTVGLEFYSPSSAGLGFLSSATPTVNGGAVVSMYGAQDVQVNLAANARSTTAGQTGAYITIQLILN